MLTVISRCPSSISKCEWRTIKDFVRQYNHLNQTNYERASCLDRESPNGSPKEPEVLLNSPGQPDIVIEQKSVAWSEQDHFRDDFHFHLFAKTISSELRPIFDNHNMGRHILYIHEDSIKGSRQTIVSNHALAIANHIKENISTLQQTGLLASNLPIAWQIEAESPDDGSPDTGIGIEIRGDYSTGPSQNEATQQVSGYIQETNKAADKAVEKFVHYPD